MVVCGLIFFAGLGALGRYCLSVLNRFLPFPIGTLLANYLASFILAYATKYWATADWLPILTVGLVGGLGTYSSVQLELSRLLSNKHLLFVYFLLTYLGSLLMIFLGFSL